MTNNSDRSRATNILANVEDPSKLQPIAERPDVLEAWLTDENPQVRANTARVIGSFANVSKKYLEEHPEITDILNHKTTNDSEEIVRIEAAIALCEFGFVLPFDNIRPSINRIGEESFDQKVKLLTKRIDQLRVIPEEEADFDKDFLNYTLNEIKKILDKNSKEIQNHGIILLSKLIEAVEGANQKFVFKRLIHIQLLTDNKEHIKSIFISGDDESRKERKTRGSGTHILAQISQTYPDVVEPYIEELTNVLIEDQTNESRAAKAIHNIAEESPKALNSVSDKIRKALNDDDLICYPSAEKRIRAAIDKLDTAQKEAESNADKKAERASKLRTDGDEYFHNSAFEKAETAYERSQTQYTDAIEIVSEYNLTTLVEQFTQQRNSVEERLEYTKLARLSETITMPTEELAAQPEQSARQLIDALKELTEIEESISESRQETIAEIREQAEASLTESFRQAVISRLDEAKTLEADGELLPAKDTYQEAKKMTTDIPEKIRRYASCEFDEVRSELETKCSEYLTQIEEKIVNQNIGEIEPIEPLDSASPPDLSEEQSLPNPSEIDVSKPGNQGGVKIPDDLQYKDINKGRNIGGMQGGAVYESTINTEDGPRRIALKEPKFEQPLEEPTHESLLNEIAKWDRVGDHPYVVDILEWDTEPHPWIAMEYMDEEHLAIYSQQRTIAVDEALWIGECLADALAHAHNHDIVHTDIKPRNILLTSTGDAPWSPPKIADWGLARFLQDHSGSQNDFSTGYGAPEQFTSTEFGGVSYRTDEYQLGIVLYELLADRHPFPERPKHPSKNILREKPQRLTEHADVPMEVVRVIEKMIEPYQADRHGSMEEIREQLNELRTGEKVSQTTSLAELADVYADLVRQSRFSYIKTKQSVRRLRRFVDDVEIGANVSDVQEEIEVLDEEWLPAKDPDKKDTPIKEIDSDLYYHIEEICDAIEQICAKTSDRG